MTAHRPNACEAHAETPGAPSARQGELYLVRSRDLVDDAVYDSGGMKCSATDELAGNAQAFNPPSPRRGLVVRLFRRVYVPLLARARMRWPVIKRTLPRDLVIVALLGGICQFFALAYVATDSMHTTLALVIKGAHPAPGEMAVFAYPGEPIEGYYADSAITEIARQLAHAVGHEVSLSGPRKGEGFVKYLLGTPGDRIERIDRDFFLNTRRGRFYVGRAKTHTKRGVPLEATAEQVIPDGFVYVWAPHVDALDSRYDVLGLVPASAIVGKAIPLW